MELISFGSGRRAAIGAGIFLIVGIGLIVAWALVNFGGLTGRTEYTTMLEDVSGLRPGANVEIGGYQIGTVSAIDPEFGDARPRFRVVLSLHVHWPIPDDSVALIGRPNPVAAPVVVVRPGVSPTMLQPGATIAPGVEAGIENQAEGLIERANRLVDDQIVPLVADLRVATGEITGHISDNVPPILYDVRHLLATVNGTVERVEGDLANVTARMSEVVSEVNIDRLNAVIATAADAAARLNTLLAQTEQLVANTDRLVTDADTLVTDIDGVVRETAPDVQTLAGDARFAMQAATPRLNMILVNLERATEDLAGLVAELRANPAVIIGVESGERGPR